MRHKSREPIEQRDGLTSKCTFFRPNLACRVYTRDALPPILATLTVVLMPEKLGQARGGTIDPAFGRANLRAADRSRFSGNFRLTREPCLHGGAVAAQEQDAGRRRRKAALQATASIGQRAEAQASAKEHTRAELLPDQVCIFCALCPYEGRELSHRHEPNVTASLQNTGLHFRVGEDLVYLAVKAGDNILRRSPRSENPDPESEIEILEAQFSHGWHIRQDGRTPRCRESQGFHLTGCQVR